MSESVRRLKPDVGKFAMRQCWPVFVVMAAVVLVFVSVGVVLPMINALTASRRNND